MAERKPLVIIAGQIQELPAADTVEVRYFDTITVTVAVSGGDFTTVQGAIDWVEAQVAAVDTLFIISIAAGSWTHTSALILRPRSAAVQLSGTYYTTTLTSVASSSGSSNAYSYVLNVADNSNIDVGDWVGIDYTSGGTNARNIEGGFEVTAKATGTITILATHSSRTAVASGAVTGGIHIFKTLLKFTDCGGLTVTAGRSNIALSNIALIGNDSTGAYNGVNSGAACFTNISSGPTSRGLIAGFAVGMYITQGGTAKFDYGFMGRLSNNHTGYPIAISVLSSKLDCLNSRLNCDTGAATSTYGIVCTAGEIYADGTNVIGVDTGVTAQGGGLIRFNSGKAWSCNLGLHANRCGIIEPLSAVTTNSTTAASPAAGAYGNENGYVGNIT